MMMHKSGMAKKSIAAGLQLSRVGSDSGDGSIPVMQTLCSAWSFAISQALSTTPRPVEGDASRRRPNGTEEVHGTVTCVESVERESLTASGG